MTYSFGWNIKKALIKCMSVPDNLHTNPQFFFITLKRPDFCFHRYVLVRRLEMRCILCQSVMVSELPNHCLLPLSATACQWWIYYCRWLIDNLLIIINVRKWNFCHTVCCRSVFLVWSSSHLSPLNCALVKDLCSSLLSISHVRVCIRMLF